MAFGTAHSHALVAPVDRNANVRTVTDTAQDPQLACQLYFLVAFDIFVTWNPACSDHQQNLSDLGHSMESSIESIEP